MRVIGSDGEMIGVLTRDEALAKAVELGGTVLQGKQPITETSWWAFFRDPDGNVIGLYEGTT